tara:strand:+ start:6548 stop:6895 length:348 start_codon:yes stop_codon:yes gene_type:complete
MKQYNNGQRSQKMYGGGMAMRKPMMQQPKMGMTGMAGTGQMSGMNTGGKLTSNKAKINKVTTGLRKAVKAHTGQAKMLSSIKLNKGGKLNEGLQALKKERPDVVKKMGFKKGGQT